MNTLSRAITARILPTPDTYAALRRQWRAVLESDRKHELTAAHHLLYLALLGKDWRRAFTPITNRRKLDNGAFYDWGLFHGLAGLHRPSNEAELLAPFAGLITPEMVTQIRKLIPYTNGYGYRAADFTPGAFPFAAYEVPADLLAPAEDHIHA